MPIVEGHRPLLVEVQALVVPSTLPSPRRSAQGLDQGRLALLVAVLTNRAGLPFAERDVYASVVGGLRLGEPGSDLGVCLALASAHAGTPLAGDLIACAEVGLGGELRLVGQTPRRLAEAARLGFRRAIVPTSAPDVDAPIELLRATNLAEALASVALGSYVAIRAIGPSPSGSGSVAVGVICSPDSVDGPPLELPVARGQELVRGGVEGERGDRGRQLGAALPLRGCVGSTIRSWRSIPIQTWSLAAAMTGWSSRIQDHAEVRRCGTRAGRWDRRR